MASGGHARSGRIPDPNALRRDRDHAEWVTLPVSGRSGQPPAWPLDQPKVAELELWAKEWARPQAVEWERNGQDLEVALFVRAVLTSEESKATAADRNVVQRKMNDLGLTVPGLRANRWRIVDESAAPEKKKPGRSRSARDRLKVVRDGEATSDDDGGRA